MKKTTFNGKQVYPPKQPQPKVNQIWQNTDTGSLLKIYRVAQKEVSCDCEKENGERFGMGFAWFNGHDYKFIGTIV